MPRQVPSADVVQAFGARGRPQSLAGGQGDAWRVGDLVLKPQAGPVQEWLAETLTGLVVDGFRLAEVVRARDGRWSWQGWSATRWVVGDEPDLSRTSSCLEVLTAGRAFHRAVAHLDRPACLDSRTDRWAVADRIAWGEAATQLHPRLAAVAGRLGAALRPLGPSQLVHADLSGNVLLSPALGPAVIDVSPCWRPPAYAEGVVVADALCWHGAGEELLEAAGVPAAAVARALLFRLVTTDLAVSTGVDGVDLPDEARRYERAAALVGV